LCPAQLPGAPHALATDGLIGINSNKEKALLRILRQLNGKGVEEVADHILALFNEPPRWKPEDQQEVYRVSECGEIRTATFRHGEHHSEALWAFGNCFKSKKDAARAREAIEQLLMTFHTPQT
jgi:hypothetical protein